MLEDHWFSVGVYSPSQEFLLLAPKFRLSPHFHLLHSELPPLSALPPDHHEEVERLGFAGRALASQDGFTKYLCWGYTGITSNTETIQANLHTTTAFVFKTIQLLHI
jgi:hypothetical protein